MGSYRRHGLCGCLILLAIAMLVAVPPTLILSTTAAEAQERPRGRTLFDVLFGRQQEQVQPAQRQQPVQTQRARRQGTAPARAGTSASSGAGRQTAGPVEKLENARRLLVIGDFMGSGLADGLQAAYVQSPGIRIVERTNGSSGFVRDDYYNWQTSIGPIIEEIEPDAVVVMIGSNDRQELRVDGVREAVRTEAWTREYERRVRALAGAIRERDLPLVWVGMPSFRFTSMTSDMLAFNDIYRSVVEELGGEFVDIWDGFVDENGAFSAVGPDMNGQRVNLRGSDGINMTSAGKRKIAFYAERAIARIFGEAVEPGITDIDPSAMPTLESFGPSIPLAPVEIERTQPISLADPALDGGGALLGQGRMTAPEGASKSPLRQLTGEGRAPRPMTGRADDFSTKPRESAVPTDETTSATTP